MSAKMTEKDLAVAGLTVDPFSETIKPVAELVPTDEWTNDQLESHAKGNFDADLMHGRMGLVHRCRAGAALAILRPRLKATKEWSAWVRDRKMSRSHVNEAIELHEWVQRNGIGEGYLMTLTWTEVKREWAKEFPEDPKDDEDKDDTILL